MPLTTIRARRLPAAVAAVVAALFLLTVAGAPPAAAHDRLVSSDPADGATVETLPAALTLTYSAEPMDAGDGTAVAVAAPSGADVTAGDPVIEGANVSVPLAEAAEAGVYTVTWRVVSSDGHPIDGSFSFTVDTPSTPLPTAEPTQTPDATVAPAPSDEATPETTATSDPLDGTPADGDSFTRNLPWIIGGLLLAALGGAAIATLVARTRRRDPAAGDDGDEQPPAGR